MVGATQTINMLLYPQFGLCKMSRSRRDIRSEWLDDSLLPRPTQVGAIGFVVSDPSCPGVRLMGIDHTLALDQSEHSNVCVWPIRGQPHADPWSPDTGLGSPHEAWSLVTWEYSGHSENWGVTRDSDQKNNQHFNYFHLILMSPTEHVYNFLKQ